MTRWIFLGLVLLLGLQRLVELRWSRRNERAIRAQGGWEVGAGHFLVMKLMHGAWLLAMIAEVFFLDRPFIPALSAAALVLLAAGQGLRYAAIRTLGWRWTVRIMVLQDAPPVRAGIYRTIRHPNYAGVILEILAVPLLHTAYLTAIIFSIANAVLLWVRIRAEEAALQATSSYEQDFRDRPRFIPDSRSVSEIQEHDH